jgi:hypothetical protein
MPPPKPQPPTTDPDHVAETLADGPFNISINGGLATITFTQVRPEVGPLFAAETMNPQAVVRARIVTTTSNLEAMRDLIGRLLQAGSGIADATPPAPATGGGTRH